MNPSNTNLEQRFLISFYWEGVFQTNCNTLIFGEMKNYWGIHVRNLESLATNVAKVEKLTSAAENLLREGTRRLLRATAAKNMLEIEVASAYIEEQMISLVPLKITGNR